MKLPILSLFVCFAATLSGPALAQDIGRVSPAGMPIPMADSRPVAPNLLRSRNPMTLPMTGNWRFQLAHGYTKDGTYYPEGAGARGISASSSETQNDPQNAFDGDPTTRWCADGPDLPQYLQADLGSEKSISAVNLVWERPAEHYRFAIEGSHNGKTWAILADKTSMPGMQDGTVSFGTTSSRYVRIRVVGTGGGWASIRECGIEIDNGGQKTTWRPAPETAVQPTHDVSFAQPGFGDSDWNTIPVPSNWEMLGYSIPTYNSVDRTVGLYRRWVTIPSSWTGKKIFWHFDGAMEGAEVFINGQSAGYHESGYTAWNIDLTGLLKPGKTNLFAVRLSKTTSSSDAETGDFQCMGGIYRETFLVAVPETHVSAIAITTTLKNSYTDASLSAALGVVGRPGDKVEITGQLFNANGTPAGVRLSGLSMLSPDGSASITLQSDVVHPNLWSAEKPNLYYLVFKVSSGGGPAQYVEQRFGFKQIEIKDNVVYWNGKPIKCTGTCRHDFWADKGFVLTDKEWTKDLDLIKSANVNAIRTSHYNHAERFLELCDEKGFYVLDEVPYCWIGDQVNNAKWDPYLLQRGQETLARDKNKPCVLAWSIGNENPMGPVSQHVIDAIKKEDPTRPAFVSSQSPGNVLGQAWEDDHYPSPGDVDRIAANTKWGANFSEHPHIFYQKETQDYDPGASDLWSEALMRTWEKLWASPTILGSFIWEWQNQGIADKFPNKTREFYYGNDRLRQENNKGIVTAYRVPKPEWWIVKMVYSPVVVDTRTVTNSGTEHSFSVPLKNHYSFTDLSELECHYRLYAGDKIVRSGIEHIACPPMGSTVASFPAVDSATKLHLEFFHRDGRLITEADLAVAGARTNPAPAGLVERSPLQIANGDGMVRVYSGLQNILFSASTGQMLNWEAKNQNLLHGGTAFNLGESKASNDNGFYRSATPPVLSSPVVTAEHEGNNVEVHVNGDLSSSTGKLGNASITYVITRNAEIAVSWQLDWTAPDTKLWEVGLKLGLDPTINKMTWSRESYFTSYPKGHIGEPEGQASSKDVSYRSSKRGLHWMSLSSDASAGFTLMPAASTLVARANATANSNTLYASQEVSGPVDFSGSWIHHDIMVSKGKPLSGSFTLRANGVR